MGSKAKRALITGITGQDGSFLAEKLLEKDYEVHGLVRRSSFGPGNYRNIKHLLDKIEVHPGDLSDGSSLLRILGEVRPDEVYNLGAQADVAESFYMPEYSIDTNGSGVIRLLEAIKILGISPKFYQASTSELFGNPDNKIQNEKTLFNPQSPYAFGKQVGYFAVKKARDEGLFAVNGILFNHESERRGEDYLTRKVTKAVARIKLGKQKKLLLGNLFPYRDWGYAPEYVNAAWLMLQQDSPEDFVIGTGETHTVQEWVERVFELADLNWKDYVEIDEKYKRSAEVVHLCADPARALKKLGWQPKVKFNELTKIMYEHDIGIERASN